MSYDECLKAARAELHIAQKLVQEEIRNYPVPVSGCDTQFNHLIGLRGAISEALHVLDTPRFVATPRTPHPTAGIESR